MPKILPPGYVDFRFQHELEGDLEPIEVTIAGRVRPSQAPFDQADANGMVQAWGLIVMPQMSDEYTFTQVVCRVGQDAPDDLIFTGLADFPGGRAINTMSQNVAYLVQKRTGLSGRRNRGRMYIPGVSESAVTAAGQVSDAEQQLWTNALSAFRNSVVNDGANSTLDALVILHNSVSPLPTVITAFRCDDRVATQRRRLRR